MTRSKADEILHRLRSMADPEKVAGIARYGINAENTLGVSIPQLRSLAKEIGRNHLLAEETRVSGVHEARLLAAFIGDSRQVTKEEMESWVIDFDSWDICDQVCGNLFDRTPFAYTKAVEWSVREEEFVRRAAFVLMASLAVHDKNAGDDRFEGFFPLIIKASTDERNFVKKAVNWALRQIGKRNRYLNARAIEVAQEISRIESKAARWIAADALKELSSDKIVGRINK